PVWANVMKDIHLANSQKMPPADFPRPAGITEVTVCSKSGMIPTADCTDGQRKEIFISGTEPKSFCTLHKFEKQRNNELLQRLQENLFDNL
ncbi:MAG: hypothetical protein J6U56_07840, partial [Spirochaetia bacterium]|nr:hypothetical protein [Spirochaetia bacterium]